MESDLKVRERERYGLIELAQHGDGTENGYIFESWYGGGTDDGIFLKTGTGTERNKDFM